MILLFGQSHLYCYTCGGAGVTLNLPCCWL